MNLFFKFIFIFKIVFKNISGCQKCRGSITVLTGSEAKGVVHVQVKSCEGQAMQGFRILSASNFCLGDPNEVIQIQMAGNRKSE